MIYTFYLPDLSCSKIAQVVTPDGANKAWADRVQSPYSTIGCNPQMPVSSIYGTYVNKGGNPSVCSSSDEFLSDNLYAVSFGSIANPSPSDGITESFRADPIQWSSAMGDMPLPYILSTNGVSAKAPAIYPSSGGYMGQLYDRNTLSSLFAQSYGIWDWNETFHTYLSNDNAGENWTSPLTWCPGNVRTAGQNCAVAPHVYNMKVNNAQNASIYQRGFVTLTFNSKIDTEQAPLTAYEIDWGDGGKVVLSGLEEYGREDVNDPYSISHSYEYWDLKTKDDNSSLNSQMPTLNCVRDYCTIKPKIKVRDNWGWCTEGRSGAGNSCPSTGVCMNATDRTTNGANCNSNADCPASFATCSDGFYEILGSVTVYER